MGNRGMQYNSGYNTSINKTDQDDITWVLIYHSVTITVMVSTATAVGIPYIAPKSGVKKNSVITRPQQLFAF